MRHPSRGTKHQPKPPIEEIPNLVILGQAEENGCITATLRIPSEVLVQATRTEFVASCAASLCHRPWLYEFSFDVVGGDGDGRSDVQVTGYLEKPKGSAQPSIEPN